MEIESALLSAVPSAALAVLDKLEAAGYTANLVGGCVRDLLLGTSPQDWDICTSAQPQEVISVFGKDQVRLTGIRQGTVSVRWDGQWFEVTTYRLEGDYQDGRHPSRVSFTPDLEKDLARRDFTINAMALDRKGCLTDPFGGQADLENRSLRCVGDPVLRFQEDSLRILRALRFRSRLGFEIEKQTAEAMTLEKDRMALLSAERVGSEVLGILAGPYAGDTLDRYRDVFLAAVPLLAPTLECRQNCPYHYGTVYQHTVDALKQLDREKADSTTALAILFHDIGKPQVKTTDSQGRDHFYDHAPAGAELTRQALSALRYSKKLQEEVCQLVAFHSLQVTPSKASVRRLLNKLGEEQLRRLIEVIRCDTLAHTSLALPRLQTLEEFSKLLEETLQEESAFSLKQLAVNGKDLTALGISPGPEMGAILHTLLEEVISGSENDRDALLARARQLARK